MLYAAVICRVRLSSETGLFPVHARWCPRGSRKGALSVEDRTRETADGPGCRAVPLEAPRAQRRTKPPIEAAALAPRTQGGARAATGLRPYLDPSFQNTAPPSQPAQHDEDTRSPVFFWTLNPLWTLYLLFLFNKSLSEAWRHTHCVCRLLLPPHYIKITIIVILLIKSNIIFKMTFLLKTENKTLSYIYSCTHPLVKLAVLFYNINISV